jgi:hypothetical protein
MSDRDFRNSYPIDFDLYDKNQQNVLYIEDRPADQQVKLEITNGSSESIILTPKPGSTPADSTHYHFALRFRPGTLSRASLDGKGKIKLSGGRAANWTMSDPVKDANGMDCLYFLAKTQLTFESQKKIIFTLLNVGADGEEGSRVTQMELLYKNMAYKSKPETNLESTRIAHLSIINHRGNPHIPLHVGFIGSDTVLNDGKTPNTLKLRITNLMRPDAVHPGHNILTFKHSTDEARASKLILSFDTGDESEEGALEKSSVLEDIDILHPTDWKITKIVQAMSAEWILQPESEDQILAGKDHLELTLSDIISGYPNGRTHLYLRCENIPGYWDGQFVCAIEKQPLVYRGDNVGIGTNQPGATLQVNGDIKIRDGGWLFSDGRIHVKGQEDLYLQTRRNVIINEKKDNNGKLIANGNLRVDGNVGIGTQSPKAKLEVDGDIITNTAKISDNPHGTDNAAFSHKNQGTAKGYALMQQKDGASFLNAPAGKDVNFSINNESKMILKSNGNVGIGTMEPTHKFHVLAGDAVGLFESKGEQAYLQLSTKEGLEKRVEFCNRPGGRAAIWNEGAGDAINVLQSGNVGIGTTDPKAKLDVNGEMKIKSQSPIVFQRYIDIGDNTTYDTKYKADEYTAAIVGFRAWGGDINEWGGGKYKTDTIKVHMDIIDGKWHIRADFISEQGADENWSADVMFVRNELCERIGY